MKAAATTKEKSFIGRHLAFTKPGGKFAEDREGGDGKKMKDLSLPPAGLLKGDAQTAFTGMAKFTLQDSKENVHSRNVSVWTWDNAH